MRISRCIDEIVVVDATTLQVDFGGYKGKGYVTEVVIIAEKLPLDDLEDIKDNLGEAHN